MSKLTRDNSMVMLIDHQVGLLTGVRDMMISGLEHNTVRFAQTAKTLGMPLAVTDAATLPGSQLGFTACTVRN